MMFLLWFSMQVATSCRWSYGVVGSYWRIGEYSRHLTATQVAHVFDVSDGL